LHLGLPLNLLVDINPANLFYFVLLLLSIVVYLVFSAKKIKGKEKIKRKIRTVGFVDIISIALIELIRMNFIDPFAGHYFNGYPIDKIIVAGFYSIILFLILFQIFYLWFLLTKSKLIFLRTFFIEFVFIIVLIIGSFLISSGFHENRSIYSGENEYDYIVIMGAAVLHVNKPSPILEHRILKAIDIYRRGLANKIICTGGNAPGEIAEAEVEKSILLQHEIPETDIIAEVKTSTTLEQIIFLRNFLSDKQNAIIVSDMFHLNRISLMATTMKLNVVPIASGFKLQSKRLFYYKLRDSVATLLFLFFGI
jgi:vancomycin permeability regulator SanA